MKFRPKHNSEFDPKDFPQRGREAAKKRLYYDVLEVPMRHGDMMVMHGRAIHRLYEVSYKLLPSIFAAES
jgi:hypothetical protein